MEPVSGTLPGSLEVHLISSLTVRLQWNEPWRSPPAPHLLRGAICEHLNHPLAHQRDAQGECYYRYPRVQFRWDVRRGEGIIVGFQDGCRLLAGFCFEGLLLDLGGRVRRVVQAEYEVNRYTVAVSDRLIRYRTRTCWLALNQRCHDAWRERSEAENAAWLDRHAVASVLMALRGLGVEFPGRCYGSFQIEVVRPCRYKDLTLWGFLGTLTTNADLPDGLGIGKAVSHGFGWLEKVRC